MDRDSSSWQISNIKKNALAERKAQVRDADVYGSWFIYVVRDAYIWFVTHMRAYDSNI